VVPSIIDRHCVLPVWGYYKIVLLRSKQTTLKDPKDFSITGEVVSILKVWASLIWKS
jgi:hypothetical protein